MADFYGTAAGADQYHADRLNTTWTGVKAAKEAALLRASVRLDADYEAKWPGWKAGERAQVRSWPRKGASDRVGYAIAEDEIPVEVLEAVYEIALREITTPGSTASDFTPSERVKKVNVPDAVSVEYAGFSNSASAYKLVIPIVQELMAALIPAGVGVATMFSGASTR